MNRIWHISDTHSYHELLKIPENIDIVIHSGDCSNYRDPYKNEYEVRDFIHWFSSLPIKHKIFVAGNHDTSIEKRLIKRQDFDKKDIIYLENNSVEINGLKIYGSPITPQFGDWSFMRSRSKICKIWDAIENNTDVLVTHGPPKSILDSAYRSNSNAELAGCLNLFKKVHKLPDLKTHLFGHIHNSKDIKNQGFRRLPNLDVLFSNGSVVEDGRFGKLSTNGNIIDL